MANEIVGQEQRQALSDGPIDWEPKAAYIGASNGDAPEFFDLFVAAMDGIAIHDCRMIPSAPSEEDYAYLNEADIIMLAGGDTAKGWNVFRENGLVEQIIARYAVGTILMGVSAGAVTADQQKQNAADVALTQQIRKALVADKSLSTYAHNVKVVSQGGDVTLKGSKIGLN